MMTGLWLSWSLNIQKPMFPLRACAGNANKSCIFI
ncbi:hypothetical protein Phage132_221 [Escherichia phage 132]|nr:hypothetical protein Phage132_221 [Escherichia phage 132]